MAPRKKPAGKPAKMAAQKPAQQPVHDAPFEKAIHDLWSAIAVSPIDFIDKVTGKAFTRGRFQSIKAGRTIKDIEKFTKHVRKLTKSLAAFVESGGSLETIRDDVKRLGQPAPRKTATKAVKKAAKKTAKKTAKKPARKTAKKTTKKAARKVPRTIARKGGRKLSTRAAKPKGKAR
jgi:hypothetical protein